MDVLLSRNLLLIFSLVYGIKIREKMMKNAELLLKQITERMQDVYYVKQRETIAQRANVGKLTGEIETLRKLLAVSKFFVYEIRG